MLSPRTPPSVRRYRLTALAAALAIAAPVVVAASSPESTPWRREPGQSRIAEYALKAAFLYRFTAFVEWPEAPPDGEAFVIGVLGEDPFGDTLEEAVAGKNVAGRPIDVRRFDRLDQIDECHLLFLATEKGAATETALAALAGRRILTVSDAEGFAESGGIIRLFVHEGKIRFEINPSVAEAEQLRVSSRLLQLAKIVGSTASGGPRQ